MVESKFDIGGALNTLIARSGKQKQELASYLNVSPQGVQKWIKQGTIAREHVRPICKFLSCSADELFGLVPIQDAPVSQSQTARYTQEMILDTVRIVAEDARRQGTVFNLETDMERFMQVLEIRADWKLKPTPANFIELGRVLERQSVSGGSVHERATHLSDIGVSGGKPPKKQRNKA